MGGGACGMPAGKATTSGGATTNIPTGTEDPLPPPPPLAQRQEECQQQPSTQQQPGHKKQASIVTMQSDGGTKVTLTRYRATMLFVYSMKLISGTARKTSLHHRQQIQSWKRTSSAHATWRKQSRRQSLKTSIGSVSGCRSLIVSRCSSA